MVTKKTASGSSCIWTQTMITVTYCICSEQCIYQSNDICKTLRQESLRGSLLHYPTAVLEQFWTFRKNTSLDSINVKAHSNNQTMVQIYFFLNSCLINNLFFQDIKVTTISKHKWNQWFKHNFSTAYIVNNNSSKHAFEEYKGFVFFYNLWNWKSRLFDGHKTTSKFRQFGIIYITL